MNKHDISGLDLYLKELNRIEEDDISKSKSYAIAFVLFILLLVPSILFVGA